MPSRVPEQLTARQLAILRQLAAGRSLAQAAASLGLSLDTAKAEALAICDTLGVASPTEAARRWRRDRRPGARLRRALAPVVRLRPVAAVAAALAVLALLSAAVMLALVPVTSDDRGLFPAGESVSSPATASPRATPTAVVLTSQVDRVIRAVVDGDYLALRQLFVSLPEPCAVGPSPPGAPPRCPAGVPDGGTVATFRYMDCERGYPESLEPVFREALAAGYRLYSASLSVGPARPPFLPGGDYRLVFVTPAGAGLSLEVTLGGVVSAWFGCGQGPAAMVAGIPTALFIVQPLGQRVTGAPWVNP
jgi:DNA-binding CsgD family transcriptional regulator